MASYPINTEASTIVSTLESKASTDFETNCLKVNDSELKLDTLKEKLQKLKEAASELSSTENINFED